MTGRKQTAVSELHSTWTLHSTNTLFWGDEGSDMETAGQPRTVRSMPHLAFQPLFPTGKKYLHQEWKASYDLHRKKVKSVKPTIDMTSPKTHGHLKVKTHEEELKRKIQRENNRLMEKLSYVMRTTGGVDNWNNYDKKSLLKEKRQQELLRITKENQMIWFRLSQCKPYYNVKSWHEDWLQTVKVMDRIACYPRGRANQQKGQEKTIKKCMDFEKEQKISADATTHSSARNRASGEAESEENENRKETSKTDDTGTDFQQDTVTYPGQNVSEKSISPDTPENPGSSDTIQITADKPPHIAQTFSSPGRSENTPPVPKTLKHETASHIEG